MIKIIGATHNGEKRYDFYLIDYNGVIFLSQKDVTGKITVCIERPGRTVEECLERFGTSLDSPTFQKMTDGDEGVSEETKYNIAYEFLRRKEAVQDTIDALKREQQ